jgi:hypothetical protein
MKWEKKAVSPNWKEEILHNKLRQLKIDWPIVLAGPIVRRAGPSGVTIWLATRIPIVVDAYVRLHRPMATTSNPIGRGTAASIPVLHRLHVTVVTIKPTVFPSFPVGEALLYNMSMRSANKDFVFIDDAALRSSEITVGQYKEPSFTIAAPDRTDASFIHTSCRKLHGRGMDAIPRALQLLEKTANDPQTRPTALILTGDQIYADDVLAEFIPPLKMDLSVQLVGNMERLPDTKKDTAVINAGERGKVVGIGIERDGFTAGSAGKNHLLGIGEFAATYLLSWSPELWEKYGAPALKPILRSHRVSKSSGKRTAAKNKNSELRKLFANIPTYMIFDDHEITDDWNISRGWYDSVQNWKTTRRVVSNGLAMFATFQAAGNNPSKFLPLLNKIDAHPAHSSGSGRNFDDAFWKYKKDFSFVSPTVPPVVFMDTRTRRLLEKGKAPGLLNDQALAELRSNIRIARDKIRNRRFPLVIVSPVPVIGYSIEELQRIVTNVDSRLRSLDLSNDPESWPFHRVTFFKFLDVIADEWIGQVVFLSGDVHYGFSAVGRYRSRKGNSLRTLELVQLTSSASKNQPSNEERAKIDVLAKLADNEKFGYFGWWKGSRLLGVEAASESDKPVKQSIHEQGRNWDLSFQAGFVKSSNGSVVTHVNNVGSILLGRTKNSGWKVRHNLLKAKGGTDSATITESTISNRVPK